MEETARPQKEKPLGGSPFARSVLDWTETIVMAVVLVAEGQRRLRNRRIPMSFRGLPITLLYLGMLALAIYGFTGHTPAI